MSKYLFTAREFADKCLALAKNYNTAYALGMWGFKLTREVIDAKAKQYPGFYKMSKTKQLYALADEGGYWGFDCVCMIKALLWGWGSDLNDKRGGAKYASNGVPDFGADSIGKYCDGFTSDFSQIEPGEALWMDGHVGVYVGGGLAVECTAAWESKVIVTAVGNVGAVSGYHTRTWKKHGKMKWLDYAAEPVPDPVEARVTALEKECAALAGRATALEKECASLAGRVTALEKENAALGSRLAATEKKQAEHDLLLKIYHYWSEIKNELPWAYKPLRALYDAGLFSGYSPSDLNVCRLKIECLVPLAASLRKMGEITY